MRHAVRERPQLAPAAVLLLLPLAIAGCGFQSYKAKPIGPVESAARLQQHALDDPKLRDYMAAQGQAPAQWPLASWNLARLTLAAVYFHPDIELAAARSRVAQAQTATARIMPSPVLSLRPEYNSKVGAGETPWGLGVTALIPIDLGGKTVIRADQAASLEQAARLEVGAAAWRVRSRLRRSLLDYHAADETARALEREQQQRSAQLALMEKRLTAGEASRNDVSAIRLRMTEVEVALRRAVGRREQARAAVAEALGLPLERLVGVKFDLAAFDAPPAALDLRTVRERALINRIDLRRKLAEYAAADLAVKLEIARQYPDFSIGPGFFWDADEAIWSLLMVSQLMLPARRNAQIREAEARREVEERAFVAMQASVIAEAGSAWTRYTQGLHGVEAAQAGVALAKTRLAKTQRQFDAGYADRMDLRSAELEATLAERALVVARVETQQGLSALEDAVQRPLEPVESEGATTVASPAGAPPGILSPVLVDDD
jgi:outer membrane protein TolC